MHDDDGTGRSARPVAARRPDAEVRRRVRGPAVLALVVALLLALAGATPASAVAPGAIHIYLTGASATDGVMVFGQNASGWTSVTKGVLDAGGHLMVGNLDPGTYVVLYSSGAVDGGVWSATSPYGYGSVRVVVAAGAEPTVTLVKGATTSLSGTVVGPGGVPVVGAAVCFLHGYPNTGGFAVSLAPCGPVASDVVTGTGGTFTINGVPPGPYRLFAGDPTGALGVGVEADAPIWVVPGAPTTGVQLTLAAGFSDVPLNHPFLVDISWLAARGISTGYPNGTFAPSAPVTRQAMASFLYKYAGQPATALAEPYFADVAPSHPFYAAIQWMSTSLSTGTPNPVGGKPLYRPNDPVSRQAMAAFLWRFAGSPAVAWPDPAFADVGTGQPFFTAVQWMAWRSISAGTPNPPDKPLYLPSAAVSRQAMAAFLHRFHDHGGG